MIDNRRRSRIAAMATGAVTLGSVLAGCAALPNDEDGSAGASARFVACLNAAGVEARISDDISGGAFVLVKIGEIDADGGSSVSSSAESGGEAPLVTMGDSEGSWVAARSSAYFVDDPDTRDAYAACEAEHTDFAQPDFDPDGDPAVQEQLAAQQQNALDFARCARDEGFAWVADPGPDSAGAIALPADLTEPEFRAVLTACWDSTDVGFGWSLPADDLGFDWQAVLMEFMDGTGGIAVTRDEE